MKNEHTNSSNSEMIFVFFNDKNKDDLERFFQEPWTVLSQKTLDRRDKLQIGNDERDVKISEEYIIKITESGLSIISTSKWLNGVAVKATPEQMLIIKTLPFVKEIESFVKIKPEGYNKSESNKYLDKEKKDAINCFMDIQLGKSDHSTQLKELKIDKLHMMNLTGKGVTIAVLDTWFNLADTNGSGIFKKLWDNNRILECYNFPRRSSDIFSENEQNRHGARVLSVMGGNSSGSNINEALTGAAYDASYCLYLTDDNKDVPEEELYWIEAAEKADKIGADIINSSLVYHTFDDDRYSYLPEHMDGRTSFIARGAQVASDKGIIVVNGAGNDGVNSWRYIGTPADNPDVFTVGGIDCELKPYGASSYGPNAAGHPKPDAAAKGVWVFGLSAVADEISYSNAGTSFASPLAAGGIACLLEGIPGCTPRSLIKEVLRNTAVLEKEEYRVCLPKDRLFRQQQAVRRMKFQH